LSIVTEERRPPRAKIRPPRRGRAQWSGETAPHAVSAMPGASRP